MTEEILYEIKFVTLMLNRMVGGGYIYNLYFTDTKLMASYLSFSMFAKPALGFPPKHISPNKWIKEEDENVSSLIKAPEDITKLHEKNFVIPYSMIEKVIIKKVSFRLNLKMKSPYTFVGQNPRFLLWSKKDKDTVNSVLSKLFPGKVIFK